MRTIIRWWRNRRAARYAREMRSMIWASTERALRERIAPRHARIDPDLLEEIIAKAADKAAAAVEADVFERMQKLSGRQAVFAAERMREMEPFVIEQAMQSTVAEIEGRTPPDLWTPPPGSPLH